MPDHMVMRVCVKTLVAAVVATMVMWLSSPVAHANWSKGGFSCGSRVATAWRAGTDPTGAWFGSAFDTSGDVASMTLAGGVNEDRVLLQAMPTPAATTYRIELRARFSSASQRVYWHILGIQNGVTISLNQQGVPVSISQPGVKSLYRGNPPAGNANANWYSYAANFTLSAADAAAYQYIAIALVASRAGGQVAEYDDVYTDMPALSVDPDAGLEAAWFTSASAIANLNSVNWTSPVRTTREEQVNWINTTNAAFTPGIQTDRFAVRLTGSITIPASGSWTFTLGADDGCSLTINNVVLINHIAPQSFTSRNATTTLNAGTYPIEVRWFENGGQQGLRLSWRGPGMGVSDYVPASAFQGRRLRVIRWREESRFD